MIYYQTARIIHLNLLRITTANAIMWCDIFHLFVGRNKKTRKPVMEGNFRLIINIEGHNANLHCLFWYFKNIWPFLLTLISLNKDMKAPVPSEYKVSVRQLLKFTFIYKKNIFEKYYQKPLPTYFDSKT